MIEWLVIIAICWLCFIVGFVAGTWWQSRRDPWLIREPEEVPIPLPEVRVEPKRRSPYAPVRKEYGAGGGGGGASGPPSFLTEGGASWHKPGEGGAYKPKSSPNSPPYEERRPLARSPEELARVVRGKTLSNPKTLRCALCGEKGHFALDCSSSWEGSRRAKNDHW